MTVLSNFREEISCGGWQRLRITLGTIVQILSHGIPEGLFAHAQIVPSRGLNILVASELFDKRNVRAVVP